MINELSTVSMRKNTNSMYHLQFVNNFFEINSWYLFHHDLDHSSSDVAYLRWLGITCFLDLVWLLLGEANTEQTKVVTIGGLNVGWGFDKCLHLAIYKTSLQSYHNIFRDRRKWVTKNFYNLIYNISYLTTYLPYIYGVSFLVEVLSDILYG